MITTREKDALARFFKAIVAKDEAEEPLRRGRTHYDLRGKFDAANGELIDAAKDVFELLEGRKK